MAGICKKMLASEATISKIIPTSKNLPIKLKSFLVVVAIPAMVNKITPVPPAAKPTIWPPLRKFKACCKIGPSIKPSKKVSPSNNTTPMLLLRLAEIAANIPNITAIAPIANINGCNAAKAKFIFMPTIAPITVGIMVRPSMA